MLLDEPTNALDLAHQVGVLNVISRLCRESSKAIIMVSHDLNMAYAAATHALLIMEDGNWQAGPVAEVMRADLLSTCLGYPIEIVQHGARRIFLPAEDTDQAGMTMMATQTIGKLR
jgi:iron complex transport system ATP-binding protein